MPRPAETADASRRRPSAFVVLWAVGIVGLTGIAGCSSGASGPPAAPPPPVTSAAAPPVATPSATSSVVVQPSAALCSAATEFRVAANNISSLDANAVGVEGVKAALQKLETTGKDLAAAAKAEFGPEVDDLATALGSLQSTITSLSDQASLSAKLGALTTSVSAVEQAAAPIMDSAEGDCPSVPPAVLPS
jgi:hypothetical protein